MAHQELGKKFDNEAFIAGKPAKVAELVDAPDLGSGWATSGSSSLPFRTSYIFHAKTKYTKLRITKHASNS